MDSANPLITLSETVYGPVYVSAILSTAFYGVSCMQTFFYYVHYPNDSRRMKNFVAVLWALDTIHEALTIAGVYKYIVLALGNPLFGIQFAIPELIFQTLPMVLVATSVQAFFVYRLYIFSNKNIVAPLLWIIQAIYQIVINTIYVAKAFESADGIHNVNYTIFEDDFFTGVAISSLALAAAVDVLIAIAMTFLLLRQRNATGFADTAHVLQRLATFAVNTGIWTATFAVLSVILLRVFSGASYYVVFSAPLSSVYCNMLLANLNARAYIRGGTTVQATGPDQVDDQFPSIYPIQSRKTEW